MIKEQRTRIEVSELMVSVEYQQVWKPQLIRHDIKAFYLLCFYFELVQKFTITYHHGSIDLSSKAIISGRAKYKKIKLLKLSSLEIYKIKPQFDLIICGFFLYLLDREEIFNQFNLIYKKLKTDGYLIIEDFDPMFKHSNKNIYHKSLKSFKMNYSNFLEESGLFKMIYKIRNDEHFKSNKDKKSFKSNDTSISLFKKMNFNEIYPNDL
jgi:hypothetical protein